MFRTRAAKIATLLVLSFGAGTVLILAARYLRRRRRQPSSGSSPSYNDQPLRRKREKRPASAAHCHSLLDASMTRGIAGPDLIPRHRVGRKHSHYEEENLAAPSEGRTSEDSAVDVADVAHEEMVVESLIKRGVEDFQSALEHWYGALEQLTISGQASDLSEVGALVRQQQEVQLHALIGSSRKLRKTIGGSSVRESPPRAQTPTHVLTWLDEEALESEQLLPLEGAAYSESSDTGSFVSATETAQLEFDDMIDEKLVSESQQLKMFRETILYTAGGHSHLEFYTVGLEHYIRHGVSVRKMRTSILNCGSDMDFLAKVYCLREASEMVFSLPHNNQWFAESGREALVGVIRQAGKDPSEFQAAFDELVAFSSSPDNWEQIKEELSGRGVEHMSFYDILLDFVLLDAFDDLATPPYSVAAALQNTWLSARLKETALTTAIWGVLKAKASYLEDQYGFMAHFYVVAQYVLPVLTWGFLGPVEDLKEQCEFFQEQTLGFIRDIFDFDAADYSSVSSLSESIMRLARKRRDALNKRLRKLGTSSAQDVSFSDEGELNVGEQRMELAEI